MGDAAGIGPELILKAFGKRELFGICRPLVIGSLDVMDHYRKLLAKKLGKMAVVFQPISIDQISRAKYSTGVLNILDLDIVRANKLKIGVAASVPGDAAVVYTLEAGNLAMDGTIDAIVSAPLNKESMRLAGHDFEGQTQILGKLTKSKRYGMILLLGNIRVMMLTTHTSLRNACRAVTKRKVLSMIELADETLRNFGIRRPRIAVAGLNPHSGEGGLFGNEEVKGSVPAIAEAVKRGIHAVGPVPADVVFLKAKDGEYDLVLAMYHDQANMAAKLLGFGEVVTVLAGMPIIRTSVGHGTAFDIAGRGIADERNFVMAIKAAVDFAILKKRAAP